MFYVYITYHLEKKKYQTGSTSDLKNFIRNQKIFDDKIKLVYYEMFDNSDEAARREKNLSGLPVDILKQLIFDNNPLERDLSGVL